MTNPVDIIKGMRCETCKYWSDTVSNVLPSVRICEKAKSLFNSTEWNDDILDEDGFPSRTIKKEMEGTKMFVQDGSDYYAVLYTASDFFCAHWKDVST